MFKKKQLRQDVFRTENKKLSKFVKIVKHNHLRNKNAIQAFKIDYQNRNEELISAFSSEFEATIESIIEQPIFNVHVSHVSSLNHLKVFSNLDFDVLNTAIFKLENLAFEFLDDCRPSYVLSSSLRSLVRAISSKYNYVPYHSFSHGFSVMHMFQYILGTIEKQHEILSKEEAFVCFIGCLAHDVGHKAKNNAYNVAKKSKFALSALDESVMERHHLLTLFKLLKQPENDIFAKLQPTEYSKMKKLLIGLILSTDVTKHKSQLQKLSNLDILNEGADKKIVAEVLIEASDIGNSVLKPPQYLEWARLITQEFHSQTESEAKNQLRVSDFMRYKGIRGFIDGQIMFNS